MSKRKVPAFPDTPCAEVIVIVEDSLPDQMILKNVLEKWGYQVLVADNGLKGLEVLEYCGANTLNLVGIISDILMPEMNGMEFLQKVRKQRSLKKVPFLFMTGATDNFYVADAKKHGANGFMLKPISTRTLIVKLKELFPKKDFSQFEQAA